MRYDPECRYDPELRYDTDEETIQYYEARKAEYQRQLRFDRALDKMINMMQDFFTKYPLKNADSSSTLTIICNEGSISNMQQIENGALPSPFKEESITENGENQVCKVFDEMLQTNVMKIQGDKIQDEEDHYIEREDTLCSKVKSGKNIMETNELIDSEEMLDLEGNTVTESVVEQGLSDQGLKVVVNPQAKRGNDELIGLPYVIVGEFVSLAIDNLVGLIEEDKQLLPLKLEGVYVARHLFYELPKHILEKPIDGIGVKEVCYVFDIMPNSTPMVNEVWSSLFDNKLEGSYGLRASMTVNRVCVIPVNMTKPVYECKDVILFIDSDDALLLFDPGGSIRQFKGYDFTNPFGVNQDSGKMLCTIPSTNKRFEIELKCVVDEDTVPSVNANFGITLKYISIMVYDNGLFFAIFYMWTILVSTSKANGEEFACKILQKFEEIIPGELIAKSFVTRDELASFVINGNVAVHPHLFGIISIIYPLFGFTLNNDFWSNVANEWRDWDIVVQRRGREPFLVVNRSVLQMSARLFQATDWPSIVAVFGKWVMKRVLVTTGWRLVGFRLSAYYITIGLTMVNALEYDEHEVYEHEVYIKKCSSAAVLLNDNGKLIVAEQIPLGGTSLNVELTHFEKKWYVQRLLIAGNEIDAPKLGLFSELQRKRGEPFTTLNEICVGLIYRSEGSVNFLVYTEGDLILPTFVVIIVVGNSCVGKTKRIEWDLKVAIMIGLPLPLILIFWLITVTRRGLLGSTGYGFFAPWITASDAIRKAVGNTLNYCYVDGCLSIFKRGLTTEDKWLMDITFSKLSKCVLVSAVAWWKEPYLLYKRWKDLLEDVIAREESLSKEVCALFTELAIFLWHLAALGSLIPILQSFAYVVAGVALFDESVENLTLVNATIPIAVEIFKKAPGNHKHKNVSVNVQVRRVLGDIVHIENIASRVVTRNVVTQLLGNVGKEMAVLVRLVGGFYYFYLNSMDVMQPLAKQKHVNKDELFRMVKIGANMISDYRDITITDRDIDHVIAEGQEATTELVEKSFENFVWDPDPIIHHLEDKVVVLGKGMLCIEV